MKLIAYLFTVSVLLSTMPDLPVLASPPSDQWVTGTGVLINKSGVILTNRHIVEGGCGELYAMDLQGQHSKGQVLRVSSRDDLALIQTERRDTMHVYLRVNDQHTHPILPRLNENVHVVGFLEGKFEPRGGQVVSLQDPKHGGRGITLGLSSTFGGSGSPVFDEDGLLVGLLWGGRGATGEFQANGETHLNVYALSATAIIPFLIEAAVPIGTASPVDAPFKRGPQEGFWENVDKILNISRHVVVKLYCRKN